MVINNIQIDQCLPEHTKILTDLGLKDLNTLQLGDIVFSFDIEKDELVKNKVLKKEIFDYNGNMINLKSRNIDILMVPNHKILHKNKRHSNNKRWIEDNWKYIEIKNLKKYDGIVLPITSIYKGSKSIGVDLASLVGWVITEGHFYKNKASNYQNIQISQSSVNINYVNEIRSILESLKIKFNENKIKYINKYTNKRKEDSFMYIFYILKDWNKKIRELIPNKKPTFDLLDLVYEERLAMYKSMISGDGHRYKRYNKKIDYIKSAYFCQKDEKILDWFDMLVLFLGYHPTRRGKLYVEIKEKKITGTKNNFHPKSIHYIGQVWGIISEKPNFIAYQNGKYFIASNSNF